MSELTTPTGLALLVLGLANLVAAVVWLVSLRLRIVLPGTGQRRARPAPHDASADASGDLERFLDSVDEIEDGWNRDRFGSLGEAQLVEDLRRWRSRGDAAAAGRGPS